MITQENIKILLAAVIIVFISSCSSSTSKNEQSPPTNPPTSAPTPVIEETEKPVLEENIAKVVYFDFDKYDLTPESRAVLLANSEKLKNITVSIRLEGHADERGTREYNMALGNRRAQAVRNFFVSQGIDAESLKTVSYGEDRPVATGHDESSWSLNRRVEIYY